ncbi:YaaC family protein [Streptomyces sp. NPDC058847]|uniref:YaaC family protein n=1 Tax=Streptomyces sp. NPDC058847 TaxID=3346649 RepID=UPI0036CE29F9
MYMKTEPDEAWETLRASRANPPGRASAGARRKTYAAALEQAEQMFRAAAVVGPATRSLQVFYGLSQAGRAVAAAAIDVKGEDWRLDGHGIKASGFDKPFADIEIRTDSATSRGSFVRLSQLLDSPIWGKSDPVRLEDLWDTLPVNLHYPLTDRNRYPALYADERSVHVSHQPALRIPVCDIPGWVIDNGSHETLDTFFERYPGLTQRHEYDRRAPHPDGPPDFTCYANGGGELEVSWLMPPGATHVQQGREHLRGLTRSHGRSRYFLPSITHTDRQPHLLMAWWSVVYTLSMLARYEPAAWAALISVDSNHHAVPIESLLKRAIEFLPGLVLSTIEEVSGR